MKQKNVLRNLFCCLAFIALAWACQQEDWVESPGSFPEEGSVLDRAKTWYETHYSGDVWLYPATKARGGIKFYADPSWEYYLESENETYSAIDVMLTDRVAVDFVPHENLDLYRQTRNYNYRRSYTRLVVLTEKKSSKKSGFLMTFIPTSDYVVKNLSRLNKTTYLHRDEHLDGLVLFHHLNGGFANGWQYTRGKVTGYIPGILFSEQSIERDSTDTDYVSCELLPCSYQILTTRAVLTDTTNVAPPALPADSTGVSTDSTQNTAPPSKDGSTGSSPGDNSQSMETQVSTGTSDSTSSGGITIPVIPGGGNGNYEGGSGNVNGNDTGGGASVGGGMINRKPQPQKYFPKENDKLAKKKLPSKMNKQVASACVTSILEYVDNKVFRGSITEGEFILYYWSNFGENNIDNGVKVEHLNAFVTHFFYTKKFESYKNAIDHGHVVMTDVPSQIKNSIHNCLILGYQEDGKYIYMDPELGEWYTVEESYFKQHYNIVFSGLRN